MADETRKLLKIFGVAVTDFEAESEKLEEEEAQLTAQSDKEQIAKLLKDATELCCKLNTRWLDTTQHIFAIQDRLLARCADAAGRLQADTDTSESTRPEWRLGNECQLRRSSCKVAQSLRANRPV